MARKTVRLEDLPADARREVQAKLDAENAEKRATKLLMGNTRLMDALDAVGEQKALEIFTQVLVAHRRPSSDGGASQA